MRSRSCARSRAHEFEPATVKTIDRRVAVAPMMDWTDRHCRYFLRGFSPDVLLYTEMITAGGHPARRSRAAAGLRSRGAPARAAVGRQRSRQLAAAARNGAAAGYDEINLNCGCPSERVASGAFGACLMREPALVAECVAAMRAAVRIPVTVKMRIGVVSAPARAAAGAVAEFSAARLRALCDSSAACTRPAATRDRARPQGGARRAVAQGQPRDSAVALRRGAASARRPSRRCRW